MRHHYPTYHYICVRGGITEGGATRTERGWAGRMRVQKRTLWMTDDDKQRLNELVHSKTLTSDIDNNNPDDQAFIDRVEGTRNQDDWIGGSTDPQRGKVAEAREARFVGDTMYNRMSRILKEKFTTSSPEALTNTEWKWVHRRDKGRTWPPPPAPQPKYNK